MNSPAKNTSRCAVCGYSLTGLAETASCPECGASSKERQTVQSFLSSPTRARLRFTILGIAQSSASIVCAVASLSFAKLIPEFIWVFGGTPGLVLAAGAGAWLFVRLSWIWLAGCASREDAGLRPGLFRLLMLQSGFAILSLFSLFVGLSMFALGMALMFIFATCFAILSIVRSFAECVWLNDLSRAWNSTNAYIVRSLAALAALIATAAWITILTPLNGWIWFPATLSLAFAIGAAASFLLSRMLRSFTTA